MTARVPRSTSTLAGLLRETDERHGPYEKAAPPHHWSDWYAPYVVARQDGQTPDQASQAAGAYMADVRGVVIR